MGKRPSGRRFLFECSIMRLPDARHEIHQLDVNGPLDVRSNIEVLVHFQRRFGGPRAPDQDGGYTGQGAVCWDVRENHASRSYLGPFADLQILEKFSSSPDQHVPSHSRMTITSILTGAPKSYLVKYPYRCPQELPREAWKHYPQRWRSLRSRQRWRDE